MHFGDLSQLSVFLWHVTFVYLLVLMILSFIIYRNTADRLFILYFTYISLLFTYLICRNYYFMEIQHFLPVFLYSYYIQVLYLCIYFHFGLSIINFKNYHPRFTRWIYRYLTIAFSIATLLFLAALFQWIKPDVLVYFFQKIFFPIHIGLAVFIIFKVIRLRQEGLRIYFLIGTISYIILGTTAIIANFYQPYDFFIRPVAFFYMGVIIECTFYAIGLGTRVQQLYVRKLETERLLNAAQMELRKMVILENKVLRSQMNSHFIFNILNSIKAFIVEQDTGKAVNYLNKFAKLMRRVLDASRNEYYTLADEIHAVKLYIDIEKIRITGDFYTYFDIEIDQNPEGILFPPLLIQPFVENAIWHGLSPLHGEKELIFRMRNDGPDILIEILDNGVGYQQSLATKTATQEHTSHGLDITSERIELFNAKNPYKISYEIRDRDKQPGTVVRLRLESNGLYNK